MKLIHTAIARSTGVQIDILRLDEPVEGNAWAAECVAHGWLVYTSTRREAHAEGRQPETWCEDCEAGE